MRAWQDLQQASHARLMTRDRSGAHMSGFDPICRKFAPDVSIIAFRLRAIVDTGLAWSYCPGFIRDSLTVDAQALRVPVRDDTEL